MDGFNASSLAALSNHLTQLDKNFDCIYLGFSGGLDSRVLLDLLSQDRNIKNKLNIIHINHGLSPNADSWTNWAKQICEDLCVDFQSFAVNINHNKKNIEESARNARYAVFGTLLKNNRDVLLLAHHQNDQAETLLLHLLRGAGLDGLSAMPQWRSLGFGQLYRPLLNISRKDLENYASEKKLEWINDESNENTDFDRNFLRHEIIPALQTRWPGVIKNLSRSAKHCGVAREQIREKGFELLADMMELTQQTTLKLNIHLLQKQPRDMQMVLLRLWLEKQDFKKPDQDKIERILDELIPAPDDANPLVAWKGGEVRRYQGWLYGRHKNKDSSVETENTPHPSLPPQGGKELDFSTWMSQKSPAGTNHENDLDHLITDSNRSSSFPPCGGRLRWGVVETRSRLGGEKIKLHGRTRDLKKLLQQWKVPPWERSQIPLIFINNTLACVQGYAVSDDFTEYFPEKKLKC